jgi:hypothetical protein
VARGDPGRAHAARTTADDEQVHVLHIDSRGPTRPQSIVARRPCFLSGA